MTSKIYICLTLLFHHFIFAQAGDQKLPLLPEIDLEATVEKYCTKFLQQNPDLLVKKSDLPNGMLSLSRISESFTEAFANYILTSNAAMTTTALAQTTNSLPEPLTKDNAIAHSSGSQIGLSDDEINQVKAFLYRSVPTNVQLHVDNFVREFAIANKYTDQWWLEILLRITWHDDSHNISVQDIQQKYKLKKIDYRKLVQQLNMDGARWQPLNNSLGQPIQHTKVFRFIGSWRALKTLVRSDFATISPESISIELLEATLVEKQVALGIE